LPRAAGSALKKNPATDAGKGFTTVRELLGMSERQFRRYRDRFEDDGEAV
jgi:hypothetical protein